MSKNKKKGFKIILLLVALYYIYRAVSSNSRSANVAKQIPNTNGLSGSSSTSTTTTTTTPTTTPTAPTAPSNLTATASSATQINLSFADNANNETGFDLERSTDGTNFAKIADVSANVTTYSNTGLTANTRYYYRVRAINAGGNSTYSNIANATTNANPTPPTPTGVFPNPPTDANIGIVGWLAYGQDYDTIKNELQNGTARFDFYGKNNGQAYPTGQKNGNGYETVSLTTHSIVSKMGLDNLVSKCRYKITDTAGNVVVYVDDTRGGFHPNYGANKRGNNHPDDANRYLPTGTYTLEYTNTSDDARNAPQEVSFWLQGENNFFQYQINEVVNNGQTIVRQITISDTGSTPNRIFKLNNNINP